MGFKDIFRSFFKKPDKEEPPKPEELPKEDSFSKQETIPPPKIEDFDNEIPELPDLDIPEELGGIDKFVPHTSNVEPHPKTGLIPPPPPKEKGEGSSSLPDLPPLDLGAKKDFGSKTIKVESPLKKEFEQPTEEKTPKKHVKTTFVRKDYEYIIEDEFSKIYTNLEEVQTQAQRSRRYLELIKLHNKKEKKMKEFKELMMKIYSELDYIQRIIFEKGEK